jgi:ZIP family zinc transporter
MIAMNMTEEAGWGKMSFVPAATGFLLGIFFLLMLDKIIHHLHVNKEADGHKVFLTKSTMLLLAVTLHNIPEGMAVGIVFAGLLAKPILWVNTTYPQYLFVQLNDGAFLFYVVQQPFFLS